MSHNTLNRMMITLISLFFTAPLFSQEDPNMLELGNDKTLVHLSSHGDVCAYLEKNLATSVDLIYYVKDCTLRPVIDPMLMGRLIQEQKKKVIPLDSATYSSLSIGSEYTTKEYKKDHGLFPTKQSLCQQYEKSYVTPDNLHFYYIESCQKRPLKGYDALETLKSTDSKPLSGLSFAELDILPTGPVLEGKKEANPLPKLIPDREIRAHLPSSSVLCHQIKSHVASYFLGIFFIENCHLRPIIDATLELQKRAVDAYGGIQELTTEQRLGLPMGDDIPSAEVLKKI